jgi:hypothetical protein
MQALLDGLYLVANRLAQKVKRLKTALSDLEELDLDNERDPLTTEDRARLEKTVRHHTMILRAAIDDVEDEIELAKKKLWAEGRAQNNGRPHYAEMAVTGEEHDVSE